MKSVVVYGSEKWQMTEGYGKTECMEGNIKDDM